MPEPVAMPLGELSAKGCYLLGLELVGAVAKFARLRRKPPAPGAIECVGCGESFARSIGRRGRQPERCPTCRPTHRRRRRADAAKVARARAKQAGGTADAAGEAAPGTRSRGSRSEAWHGSTTRGATC